MTKVLNYEGFVPIFDDSFYIIKQYRRHDRAIVKCMKSRVYKLGKKTIATNRNKAMMVTSSKTNPQLKDSLAEFRLRMMEEHGEIEAKHIISNLKAVKSKRSYNNQNRLLPGAEFLYQGKRYVKSAQLNNGDTLRAVNEGVANFNASKCKILKKNTGLVFI